MRVVITGSASPLGRVVLPRLAADPRIAQLIGVDRRESRFRGAGFTQVLLDTGSPLMQRVLAGADALIHLGLTVDTGDAALQLNASQNAFRCAAAQRVRRLIHVSSAAIYEMPARERPISEQHPRAALPGVTLGECQVAFEDWLDGFADEHPGVPLVRLRPHFTLGATVAPRTRAWLRAPFYLKLATTPRHQCVHETDVAQAIELALFKDADGAFNLACADAATLRSMQRQCGGGVLPLPFALARAGLRLARRRARAAWLEVLRYDLVLDTSRARRRLGWKPHYDSVKACLRAAADGREQTCDR